MTKHEDKISELIAETGDPVQRATLLILARIDTALEANTNATERIALVFAEHRAEFTAHDKRETQDRAALKGAWWAGVVFISIVQVMGGYILTRHFNTNDAQDARLMALEQHLSILEATVRTHHDALRRNGKPAD
jgi:hypothetical protein